MSTLGFRIFFLVVFAVTGGSCKFDPSGIGQGTDAGPGPEFDSGPEPDAGPLCGNGVLDGTEACDGAELGGQTCVTQGHSDGALACAGNCTFDESGCLDVVANWYDINWHYRKPVTILGSQVMEEQIDFPVLILLADDSDLLAAARTDGGDILFTADDGVSKLAHEIDTYDGATGALVAWVKVPTLAATTDTMLYMYYGNEAAAPQETPSNVWDASFSAVYHLNGDATPTMPDSSGPNDATAVNFNNQTVPGKMGNGQQMNGSDQRVTIPRQATQNRTRFTYCLWINTNENSGSASYWDRPTIIGQENSGYGTGDFGITTSSGYLGMWGGLNGGSDDNVSTIVRINDDAWHHLCAINDTNDVTLLLDGATMGTINAGNQINTQSFTLGARTDGGSAGGYHAGVYDELQISTVDRSLGWAQTSYRNQNAPDQFFTLGAAEYYLE